MWVRKREGAVLNAVTYVPLFKQSPDVPPTAPSTFEPGFEYTRALRPGYADQQWCEGLARYLDRRIRRSPRDLTAHVQRVNALVAAHADGERLYAAAIDLNTVLAGNGAALQQRIHDQISFALDDQQRADLAALRAGSSLPAGPAELHCSLSRSKGGGLRIVTEIKQESRETSDPLGFAIDLLNAGDYAEAQGVLERAVLVNPDREDIASELQGIYRAARDADSYEKTRAAVAEVSGPANPLWPPVDSFFPQQS
jgi:hypothetical protein